MNTSTELHELIQPFEKFGFINLVDLNTHEDPFFASFGSGTLKVEELIYGFSLRKYRLDEKKYCGAFKNYYTISDSLDEIHDVMLQWLKSEFSSILRLRG